MNTTLAVTKRDAKESAVAVRTAGNLPGIVYGPKQEPISIAVDKITFDKLMQTAGESTIITLTGLEEEIEVLVQDASFDVTKGGVNHVDFYAIERGKELTTNVPLEFIGEAPVEKSGASVNKVMLDVEVTCRPSALPSSIEVDLSVLETEDAQILIKDLAVAADVTLSAEPEDVVVAVSAAREEEPEEAPAAPDMDTIEVEEKGKGKNEGAAETPAE